MWFKTRLLEDRPQDRFEGRSAWFLVGGVFVGLTLVIRAPALVLGVFPADPAYYWEGPLRLFSLDLFVLFSLLALVPPRSKGQLPRYLTIGSVFFLLAYQTYEALVLSILHRNPIFYADASHVLGSVYLVLNTTPPWEYVAGVAGAGVLLIGLVWTLPRLVRRLHHALHAPGVRRGVLAANLVVWSLVGFAAATYRGIERQTYDQICLSTMECVVHNVRVSADLKRQVADRRQGAADSTYLGYRTLEWNDPPSIYLVIMESYGTVLGEAAETQRPYRRLMGRATDSLRAAGWHSATAQSEAPVFGGLSWLSVATLFLGTPIDHQPTYDALKPVFPRYPHLIHFLKTQGYRTGLLQPPVRSRPGVHVINPFDFDQTLFFDDLGYRGPKYGWGIVPDQYSLSVAHDQFVASSRQPFFLAFEMVTSHGLWRRRPPPFVDDPSVLHGSQKEARSAEDALPSGHGTLGLSSPSHQPDDLSRAERLYQHIEYDWRVLANYITSQAPEHSLVVVLGDHQPFFAADSTATTPLHVLSRDEALVRRFQEHGFVAGLSPAPHSETVDHAGVYSLLVRVLSHHDRDLDANSTLPAWLPNGVEQVALLPDSSY